MNAVLQANSYAATPSTAMACGQTGKGKAALKHEIGSVKQAHILLSSLKGGGRSEDMYVSFFWALTIMFEFHSAHVHRLFVDKQIF